MNVAKPLGAMVLSLLLTACGSFANRNSAALVSDALMSAPQRSILVVSTGAPEPCMSTGTFVDVFDVQTNKPSVPAVLIGMDFYVHKSEFSDHHGLISVFSLAPGEYFFRPKIANPYVVASKTPTFRFTARADEITYIGELFMTHACSLSTRFEIRDRYDRDVDLVRTANGKFVDKIVVKRLMTVGDNYKP